MNLIGIDLAWQSDKNTSAVAVGELKGAILSIHALKEDLGSVSEIVEFVGSYLDVRGIAIDAPLIINNITGQRSCEKELSQTYGARKASCHTSNLTLYPDAPSVGFSRMLADPGFAHLSSPDQSRWQIECYPHPAIIEIFDLPERHRYKKGHAAEKREGQIILAGLIRQLAESPVLKLSVDTDLSSCLDGAEI